MIKYVFWDFNGTILDDRILCWELLNELLKMENKKEISYEKYLDVFGFPIKEYYKKAGIEFKHQTFEEMGDYFIRKYQPLSLEQSLYEGVEKTLKTLKEMGVSNICLSASQTDNLKEQLRHFKIDKYFTEILGTDNVLAVGKRDVAKSYILENKIENSECLLVGDTDADYNLAKSLGFVPVLFLNGHQSKNKLEKLDTTTINKIEEIIKIVEGKEARK
jgi:phosphoglycolate phosphatase